MTPTKLIEELTFNTLTEPFCGGGGAKRAIQRALENGTEIPDWALPGRFIKRLKPAEREIISRLGSNMVQNVRVDYIKLLVD